MNPNRHEWLKAVTKQPDLLPRAVRLAVALWSFANDETGQLNPSLGSLCDASGLTEDTARRAIGDLEKAGWLARTVGRGHGVKSVYLMIAPGSVVTLRPASASREGLKKPAQSTAKRSHGCKVKHPIKGRTGAEERSHGCNSHIMKEQSSEQRKGARPAPHLQSFVKAGEWQALEWNKWLSDEGHRISLRDLTPLHVAGGYAMPWTTPPKAYQATERQIATKVIEWAKEQSRAHAA